MTTPARLLLADLDRLAVRLQLVDGDRLKVVPSGQPAELLARVREHKSELLGLLQAARASGGCRFDLERIDWTAAWEWFAERAGIREHDGLEPRSNAEAGALREVVGELFRGKFPRQRLDGISPA